MFKPRWWSRVHWRYALEWAVIVAIAYFYTAATLLNLDSTQLQQTGEQNESATLPMLIQQSIWRYHELPLWDHYMLTGFPFAGDPLSHFWNPVSTLPILIWGAINGMKISIFLSFIIAGLGQWLFSQVFGVRSILRLWSALLFMLSGGLALLWRLAWFPWCFAALWWALPRRDYVSLIAVAFCIALVLTAGGGYYPFYLGVSLAILVLVAVSARQAKERSFILKRAILIAALAFGLLGVMVVPLLAAYPFISKQAGADTQQLFSQPIPYALINYLVAEPRWNNEKTLGQGPLWTWFYIGWLPFVGLALAPATFVQARWRRLALIALGVLTLVILAWHANRYTPVRYIYDLLPFLYQLRFPNRLLILAASPLILLAALGLQQVLLWNRRLARKLARPQLGRWTRRALDGALYLTLVVTLTDVYLVNQSFNFAPGVRNEEAIRILSWLKAYDPDLYYINVGGSVIYWDWTVAAYEAEQPMLNFEYGRYIPPQPQSYDPGMPIFVNPRYMILIGSLDFRPGLQLIRDFGQYKVWRVPNALPFAFVTAPRPANLDPQLSALTVTAAPARLDGPNRVVVQATSTAANQRLVLLVSDFPGWQLEVNGQPAEIHGISGYLSTAALPGLHTYTFIYQPFSMVVGSVLTIVTLLTIAGLVWLDTRRYFARKIKPGLYSASNPMLTPEHLTTLRSLLNRIIPADESGPDAWEAGVGDYLLRQFEGDLKESLPLYRAGLESLDAEVGSPGTELEFAL